MTRQDLDREMGGVLHELNLCSHTPALGYEPMGRSGATTSRDLSGGDTGPAYFAFRYGPPFHEFHRCTSKCGHRRKQARTDAERMLVLERAKEELKSLRGGQSVREERPAGETAKQRDARIVKDYPGWAAKEVAREVRCGVNDVRQARVAAGREPDYGKEPEPEADLEARIARARELYASGHKPAQIARLLDVSRATAWRYIGKRAA